jgi:hypothetical protein
MNMICKLIPREDITGRKWLIHNEVAKVWAVLVGKKLDGGDSSEAYFKPIHTEILCTTLLVYVWIFASINFPKVFLCQGKPH